MESLVILGNNQNLMTFFRKLKIDWRVVLFFILLILLPFIIFSAPANNYAGKRFYPMPLADDTIPEFIVVSSPDTLREDFTAIFSSLTIALDSIPADTVTVTAIPDAQLNLGLGAGVPVTIKFAPYPMALLPQEIKVKPVDDIIFEDWHYGNITFIIDSVGSGFTDLVMNDLQYLIEDNDLMPGINYVVDADTFLTEGLTGVELLFSMNSIPTDTVIITIDPDDQMRITGTPGEAVNLIFPPNASSLSLDGVNIRAADDAIYEELHSGTVHYTITTSDVIYAGFFIPDLTYVIYDNDSVPGINAVINLDTFLTEGLTGVDMLFALKSIPSDTVKIMIDPDDQMRITGIPGEAVELIFEPNASALNFEGVSIRAYDDTEFEGLHSGLIQFAIISLDTNYTDLIIDDVIYAIHDNDSTPEIHFSIPATLEVIEGDGEIPVEIYLASVPEDTVFINVIPDLQLRLAGAPGEPLQLIFPPNGTALNPHIAIVKAYDDVVYEGTHSGAVSFEIITTDPDYSLFSLDPFDIIIFDNDLLPGIVIEDTTSMAGTEGDSILFFNVVLTSIPTSTVTINFQPDDQLDLGKGHGNLVSHKFRDDSALIVRTVDVFIYDDPFYEGLHIGIIECTITSSDTNYTALSIPDIVVDITDNDGVDIIEFDPAQFNIYPSISAGNIQFEIPDLTDNINLWVYNNSGNLAATRSVHENSGSVDLSALPSGMYTITTEINGKKYYCRISILH